MAPAAIRELKIHANGQAVGTWRLSSRGRTEFKYDDAWLADADTRPISLSLPLPVNNAPFAGKRVEAFFDNMLPESDPMRRRIQERFHTATRGPFDLLAAIGRDCVGAVQIVPADQTPPRIDRIDAVTLSETDIANELGRVTSSSALVRDEGEFRISIAGAQEKTAFIKHLGRWCRPVGSTPSTHIFKLPLGVISQYQADMRTSVENEWLCSRIVSAFGLAAANCEIGEFGPHKVLIVERFDRRLHSSSRYWLRFMQEDFAQATGTPWYKKYQSDGGPGFLQLADILRHSNEAQRDLETLFKAQLLFFLLAAIDGHAKNFSIRILAGGKFQLTPLYDVLSAWPVIGKRANEIPLEKARLAMALPGERPRYHLAIIQRRHFEVLAKKLGLGAAAGTLIDQMLAKTATVIGDVQRELPRGFPQALAGRIFDGMGRAAKLLGGTDT
jgi:serine/threonine-protein kinase HipA